MQLSVTHIDLRPLLPFTPATGGFGSKEAALESSDRFRWPARDVGFYICGSILLVLLLVCDRVSQGEVQLHCGIGPAFDSPDRALSSNGRYRGLLPPQSSSKHSPYL